MFHKGHALSSSGLKNTTDRGNTPKFSLYTWPWREQHNTTSPFFCDTEHSKINVVKCNPRTDPPLITPQANAMDQVSTLAGCLWLNPQTTKLDLKDNSGCLRSTEMEFLKDSFQNPICTFSRNPNRYFSLKLKIILISKPEIFQTADSSALPSFLWRGSIDSRKAENSNSSAPMQQLQPKKNTTTHETPRIIHTLLVLR